MKLFFGMLIVSLSSFAGDNILNSKTKTLDSNSMILEKPSDAPNFITLNVPVPTTSRYCVEYADRQVFGQNERECGYDLIERRDCSGGVYVGGGSVVVRRGPLPGGRGGIGVRVPMPRIPVTNPCRYYTEKVPRSCYFTDTYCARYETSVAPVYKRFNLEFERFNVATKINFSLDEYNNLIVDALDVPEYCIKKVVYANGAEVTGVKLKLKRSCR